MKKRFFAGIAILLIGAGAIVPSALHGYVVYVPQTHVPQMTAAEFEDFKKDPDNRFINPKQLLTSTALCAGNIAIATQIPNPIIRYSVMGASVAGWCASMYLNGKICKKIAHVPVIKQIAKLCALPGKIPLLGKLFKCPNTECPGFCRDCRMTRIQTMILPMPLILGIHGLIGKPLRNFMARSQLGKDEAKELLADLKKFKGSSQEEWGKYVGELLSKYDPYKLGGNKHSEKVREFLLVLLERPYGRVSSYWKRPKEGQLEFCSPESIARALYGILRRDDFDHAKIRRFIDENERPSRSVSYDKIYLWNNTIRDVLLEEHHVDPETADKAVRILRGIIDLSDRRERSSAWFVPDIGIPGHNMRDAQAVINEYFQQGAYAPAGSSSSGAVTELQQPSIPKKLLGDIREFKGPAEQWKKFITHTLLLKYHPDKKKNQPEADAELTQFINDTLTAMSWEDVQKQLPLNASFQPPASSSSSSSSASQKPTPLDRFCTKWNIGEDAGSLIFYDLSHEVASTVNRAPDKDVAWQQYLTTTLLPLWKDCHEKPDPIKTSLKPEQVGEVIACLEKHQNLPWDQVQQQWNARVNG